MPLSFSSATLSHTHIHTHTECTNIPINVHVPLETDSRQTADPGSLLPLQRCSEPANVLQGS
uniref:Uncharacterized protein n=1 Tax=Anguilla anguilla TaxID=7936 RepID=A0A0E9WIJ9_ANGAN